MARVLFSEKRTDIEVRQDWLWILPLALSSVTLRKSFQHPKSQFSHLQNGSSDTYLYHVYMFIMFLMFIMTGTSCKHDALFSDKARDDYCVTWLTSPSPNVIRSKVFQTSFTILLLGCLLSVRLPQLMSQPPTYRSGMGHHWWICVLQEPQMIPIVREVGETLTFFAQLEATASFSFDLAENSLYSSV